MNDFDFVNMIFNDWDENLSTYREEQVRCQELRYLILGLMYDTEEGKKLFK